MTFYLMAQDNGSIEAYCTTNNHLHLIVNIPELCQEILGATEEILTDEEKLKVTVASVDNGITDTSIERADTTATETSAAQDQPTVRLRRAKTKAHA